jgi:C4-dicarboxylate-specific signal transduction histidine kinase
MLQFIRDLLSTDSLSPHGICLTWRPELIWTHVASDAIIGLAYFSIPVVLVMIVLKRPDIGFGWVFWCFSAFILACGTTHFFSIWTLWRPDYGAEALIKAATAAASIATAVALWPLLPVALRIPSPQQLREANRDLERRIAERDEALDALRRAMEEKNRAEDMLRQSQKMEVVGQLASGVSHDFNNLLTAITMNLARAARELETGDPDKAVTSVKRAADATSRAGRLTGQLLAFARRQTLTPVTADVNQILRGMSDLLAGVLRGGPVELALSDKPCLTTVDVNQLENAVMNLVMNGRDAMASRPDPRLVIETGLEADGRVRIAVTDIGEGMTKEEAERAFEPFYTTKPPGQGTGLGLSQVYGFVRQSGGEVRIDSAPGRGATVTLLFPAAEASS